MVQKTISAGVVSKESAVKQPGSFSIVSELRKLDTHTLYNLLSKSLATDISDVGARLSSELRPIIIFDTYEELRDPCVHATNPDFVESFIYYTVEMCSDALCVISGQNAVRWGERFVAGSWKQDKASRWAQRSKHYRRHRIYLDAFSEAETRDYLTKRCSIDAAHAGEIYHATYGLPLAVAAVADQIANNSNWSNPALQVLKERTKDTPRLSEKWLAELADWIRENLLDQLKTSGGRDLAGFIRAAAVPRWFDRELLYKISGKDPYFQDKFDRFVSTGIVEHHGRRIEGDLETYSLHHIVRSDLLKTFSIDEQYLDFHDICHEYFGEKAAAYRIESDKYFQYHLESIYHRLEILEDYSEICSEVDEEIGLFRHSRAAEISNICKSARYSDQFSKVFRELFPSRIAMAVGDYDSAILGFDRMAGELESLPRSSVLDDLYLYHAESLRLKGRYEESLSVISQGSGKLSNEDNGSAFALEWGRSLTPKAA